MSDVPGVLADLLILASEKGSETLVRTNRLLRELAGADIVQAAHVEWTFRLRAGIEADPRAGPGRTHPAVDTFKLLDRLRATQPGRPT